MITNPKDLNNLNNPNNPISLCGRRDSNSHGLLRLLLRQVRIPISPRPRKYYYNNIKYLIGQGGAVFSFNLKICYNTSINKKNNLKF